MKHAWLTHGYRNVLHVFRRVYGNIFVYCARDLGLCLCASMNERMYMLWTDLLRCVLYPTRAFFVCLELVAHTHSPPDDSFSVALARSLACSPAIAFSVFFSCAATTSRAPPAEWHNKREQVCESMRQLNVHASVIYFLGVSMAN